MPTTTPTTTSPDQVAERLERAAAQARRIVERCSTSSNSTRNLRNAQCVLAEIRDAIDALESARSPLSSWGLEALAPNSDAVELELLALVEVARWVAAAFKIDFDGWSSALTDRAEAGRVTSLTDLAEAPQALFDARLGRTIEIPAD